jgi:hypothetical protein
MHPNAATPKSNLSEREFLQRKQEEARAAISRTGSVVGEKVAGAADPRRWVKTHPLFTLSAVAVGGFAVVTALTPSQERKIARTVRRELRRARQAANTSEPDAPGKPGLFSRLASDVVRLARPAVVQLVAALVSNLMNDHKPPAPTNGETDTPDVDSPGNGDGSSVDVGG